MPRHTPRSPWLIPLLTGTLALVAGRAGAQTAADEPGHPPPAARPAPAASGPPRLLKEGTRELRIGQTLTPPIELTDGLTVVAPEHGKSTTGVGLGVGYGYFVTDNTELGAAFSYSSLSDGKEELSGPGGHVNLRVVGVSRRLAYFFEAAVGVSYLSTTNVTETAWSVGAAVGLEYFVTDTWALRVSPLFNHVFVSTSSQFDSGITVSSTSRDTTANHFGLGWGIAAYF
jgi:hypothetical protein